MEQEQVILVTGATGRQGGAAVNHLLADNWRVRALTRDPNRGAARDLARRSADVVGGNLDDRASMERTVEGCYGVLGVQQSLEIGFDAEVRQGKLLADVAREAGVQHFIYSSVGGADRNSGIPHFESKWQIEQYIRSLDLPSTVLRPVFFYDNFSSPEYRDSIRNGILAIPMEGDRPLQMIAVEDIGGFVALAFRRGQQFIGQSLEIAGDELTMPQVADIFTRVTGKRVKFQQTPIEQLEQSSREMAVMFRWFNEQGYRANIAGLREINPSLMTFQDWAMNVWRLVAATAA